MCGRTACTLAPDHVVRACGYRSRKGDYQRPVWKDPPGGQQYYPSYNMAPSAHTPVLLSSKHYRGEVDSSVERVLQPMKWGLVPPWHKGDPYKVEYDTNNCRAEGMLTKRTYKTALEKGNRCVVLADGFFEWKRGPEGKQPYFIYFPQSSPDSKPDTKPDNKPDTKSQTFPKALPNPVKTDCPPVPSSQSKVKREPARIKPGPDGDKPDTQLSAPAPVKQEPVCVKPDPDAVSSSPVRQEPVYVKPDPDAVTQPVKREASEDKETAASSVADELQGRQVEVKSERQTETKKARQTEAGEDECDGDADCESGAGIPVRKTP